MNKIAFEHFVTGISNQFPYLSRWRAFREFSRESELSVPVHVRSIYYFSSFQRAAGSRSRQRLFHFGSGKLTQRASCGQETEGTSFIHFKDRKQNFLWMRDSRINSW